jgi:hypothetical protein
MACVLCLYLSQKYIDNAMLLPNSSRTFLAIAIKSIFMFLGLEPFRILLYYATLECKHLVV